MLWLFSEWDLHPFGAQRCFVACECLLASFQIMGPCVATVILWTGSINVNYAHFSWSASPEFSDLSWISSWGLVSEGSEGHWPLSSSFTGTLLQSVCGWSKIRKLRMFSLLNLLYNLLVYLIELTLMGGYFPEYCWYIVLEVGDWVLQSSLHNSCFQAHFIHFMFYLLFPNPGCWLSTPRDFWYGPVLHALWASPW